MGLSIVVSSYCMRLVCAPTFGVNTERKNPFFAPLRPKGHMCLRAGYFISPEYFGVNTKRENTFRAPLRPKGHMCLRAGYFKAEIKCIRTPLGGVHCHTPQTPVASVFHGFTINQNIKDTK